MEGKSAARSVKIIVSMTRKIGQLSLPECATPRGFATDFPVEFDGTRLKCKPARWMREGERVRFHWRARMHACNTRRGKEGQREIPV